MEELFEKQDRPVLRYDIVVIGGGPAGIMAALSAKECGASVIILEKNPMLGKKLRITGKGRCNITNACDFDTLMDNIPGNGKFLYSTFSNFSNYDIMSYFEDIGVPVVVERGGRVFPKSQKAVDVVEALKNELKSKEIKVRYDANVKEIIFDEVDGRKIVKGVLLSDGLEIFGKAIIIATGGITYPVTGSTGDGFKFAKIFGHTVTPLKPSLVGMVCEGDLPKQLQGLSLKNIGYSLFHEGRKIYYEQGEMLFTQKGISGPVVISSSRDAIEYDYKNLSVEIDLKPALTEEKLESRILRDFESAPRKQFKNSLDDLLPRKMIPVVIKLSLIPEDKCVNEITQTERKNLVNVLKHFTLKVRCAASVNEAIVTKGGVKISEINPKTMQSKLNSQLFFAGEIIDVDAYTGGFNLTIAFSTGKAAGKGAAEFIIANE